jgi:LacI family transcriptional regulator
LQALTLFDRFVLRTLSFDFKKLNKAAQNRSNHVGTITMSKSTPPTLEDVSRLAGVSTATISRALNDPNVVAKKTRDKIETAINTLGYTPNSGGRMLASARSNTVGAIIPTMANAIFANGLQAFQEALSDAGVTLLVASTGYDPKAELTQIRNLMAHGAGGLLLIGQERPEDSNRFLAIRNIPHVLGWCYGTDPDAVYVGFDNNAAAYDATLKVLDMGHRRIAMISGILDGNDRAQARRDGVHAAISQFGQGAELVASAEAPYVLQGGRDGFDSVQSAHPTAIICGNDVVAAGAMTRAQEVGMNVPRDVSIIGFDDIGLASAVSPRMSTVRVPQEQMGKAAAEVLIARMSGGQGGTSVKFPTEFIQRGSLAPPRVD